MRAKSSMHLKSSVPEFTQTLEREVIPLLRKQKVFRDEITFVAPGGSRRSIWYPFVGPRPKTPKATNRGAYAEVGKALAKVIDELSGRIPMDVANSTFPRSQLLQRPEADRCLVFGVGASPPPP